MKNILCRIGLHKPDKFRYLVSTSVHKNGKKYHRNYVICERCGKRIATIARKKNG